MVKKKHKSKDKSKRKANIPKAIREQCWIKHLEKNINLNVL